MKIPLSKKYQRNVTRFLRRNPGTPVLSGIAFALGRSKALRNTPHTLADAAKTRRGRIMLKAIANSLTPRAQRQFKANVL